MDVQITDRNGKPIKGLKQDQFSVSEDGKDQKVSTFDYYDVENIEKAEAGNTAPVTVSIGGVAAPEQLRQTLRDRRLIVLFFDLTSLQNDDLTRSTNAAKKFLKDQMTAADLVGVVAFGNQLQRRLRFHQRPRPIDRGRGRAASRQGIAARRARGSLRVRE